MVCESCHAAGVLVNTQADMEVQWLALVGMIKNIGFYKIS
jgi:hypothetical protein